MNFAMSMIRSMHLQESYIHKLNLLSNKLNNAKKLQRTKCQKCGLCCWRRPCDLAVGDEVKIAEYLKISKEDLFNEYLVVDEFNNTLCLLPARTNQKEEELTGKYLPSEHTFDIDYPCVFFNTEKSICTIHKVCPTGAQETECWNESKKKNLVNPWTIEELNELGWDGDKYWMDND